MIALSFIHAIFFLLLHRGWTKLSAVSRSRRQQLSVIIPMRNEAGNVGKLLEDLNNQELSKKIFEVIIVDDSSTDDSILVAKSYLQTTSLDASVLQLSKGLKGKKEALTYGIKQAKYGCIVTTDADCRAGKCWLNNISAGIKEYNVISAPVILQSTNLFERLQQTEFSILQGYSAISMFNSRPSISSGANLIFKKSAFNKVNGYKDNLFIPSGDDEFLIQNINAHYPNTCSFLFSKVACVRTMPASNMKDLLSQRKRWTSKWKYNKSLKFKVHAVYLVSDFLAFGATIFATLFGFLPLALLITLFFFRVIIHFIFVQPVHLFLGGKSVVGSLLILEIIYPFYMLYIAFNSIFGSYSWKGRDY